MTELAIYVSKQLFPDGSTTFLLSSNKSRPCMYLFPRNELPKQNYQNEEDRYQSFNGQIEQLLRNELPVGTHNLKVFYNQEYKTIGECLSVQKPDTSIEHTFKQNIDLIPLEKHEIFHFMKLFHEFGK